MFSEKGQEIIQESGLIEVADTLIADPGLQGSITGALFDYDAPLSRRFDHVPGAQLEAEAWETAKQKLSRYEQRKTWHVLQGRDDQRWTVEHETLDDRDRLFGVPKHDDQGTITLVDRIILTGAVGLEYDTRRAIRRMFSGSGQERFGFEGKQQAAAFAGAYLLSRIFDHDERYVFGNYPSFSFTREGYAQTVFVGGDMHGDFRMHQISRPVEGMLDPQGTPVEFMPTQRTPAYGYHSMEPHITLAMLEHAIQTHGEVGLELTLAEFASRAINVLGSHDTPLSIASTGFGDYGGNELEMSFLASDLRRTLDRARDPEPHTIALRAPYLPQSSTDLVIRHTEDGLDFYNQDRGNASAEEPSAISIHQEFFGDMFEALLVQAAKALGRTSVSQHLFLLEGGINMLAERESGSRTDSQ